ncbi:MAG TPA: hypothetical protein VNO25_20850 [Streptosporangiaceae bacterium]|nr:hypothetical protein [Streptosporangiaceae bacterium]
MNGPRSAGPEYTGKHRRDSGPGVLPPAWGRGRTESYARAESHGRPAVDSRPAPDTRPGSAAAALPSRRTESGFRSEAGK